MKTSKQITIEIEYDGNNCAGCQQLIHASYGWFCAVYASLVDKTDDGFARCKRCLWENPPEAPENYQETLF
ncbi:MAG: hypothetical protein IJF84_13750 [Thermoguttaceae bacterium]|nr:hypothetical protein [Thermoguttaceae bacterium]